MMGYGDEVHWVIGCFEDDIVLKPPVKHSTLYTINWTLAVILRDYRSINLTVFVTYLWYVATHNCHFLDAHSSKLFINLS